ncbi:hypothetical protein CERZMDRAFT_89808 [Cercospora zeae-maydis SCOH1-5]|uniref:Proteasome maturation factor UMP1 n=1 Tax=Cercospora zeae-maydis SCOH1-5 TaxID=717836 RepID=A0A6A6FV84_9PEZI|nr:hypothetical protein CERZMDRAFT_89808 [Cercospora zeae-maydis SCOH1-5]
MSLRIVPSSNNPTHANLQLGAPSAPGVHDTLRSNLSLSTPAPKTTASGSNPTLQSSHPLENRLANWRAQQDTLKNELLRRQFGIAEPVKRQMELAIVRAGEWRPKVLGAGTAGSGLHADILMGRDCELDWEDVFSGGAELRNEVDFHTEMEMQFKMNSW